MPDYAYRPIKTVADIEAELGVTNTGATLRRYNGRGYVLSVPTALTAAKVTKLTAFMRDVLGMTTATVEEVEG